MEIENVGQAIGVLIQGVKIAQAAGVYTLDNSRALINAIDYLVPPSQNKEEQQKPDEEAKD